MTARPPRLPPAAARVVKQTSLTPTEKLIWQEDLLLDSGTEGCWLDNAQMGHRLHLDANVVKVIRWRLKELGLYVMVVRGSWVATLPPVCVPSARPSQREVDLLAAELEAHITVNRGLPPPEPRSSTRVNREVNGHLPASKPGFTSRSEEVVSRQETTAETKASTTAREPTSRHSPAFGAASTNLLPLSSSAGEVASQARTAREPQRIGDVLKQLDVTQHLAAGRDAGDVGDPHRKAPMA